MAQFTPPTLKPTSLAEMRAAATRLTAYAERTPLLPLNVDHGSTEIYLKLESLQPVGSFKVRPCGNIMRSLEAEEHDRPVFTASSGNLGIAMAWTAAKLGLDAAVVVPEDAPAKKLEIMSRYGARIHRLRFADWWEVIMTHTFPGEEGVFIDGVGDPRAIAGNATVGLEILEQLPDVDAVMVPFGGGGLSSGIASALRALKPQVDVIACESEMSTPLTTALAHGAPTEVAYQSSFISGMGASSVLPWMWPLVRELIKASAVVSLEQVAEAVRILIEHNHIIAEGAGAVPVAAALAGSRPYRKVVCVISGGNLDAAHLRSILHGQIPK